MAKLLRNLMLTLFVSKRNHAAANAVLDAHRAKRRQVDQTTAGRAELIKQALATRERKEHVWTALTDEQKEELMGSLGEGMRAKIEAMQAGSIKTG